MNSPRKPSLDRIQDLALRWLTLVAAPATVSLAVIIITNLAKREELALWLPILTLVSAFASILLYLAAYTRALTRQMLSLSKRLRSRRYRDPRILILDGTITGDPKEIPPIPLHTDRTPADWRAGLAGTGWDVAIGPIAEMEGLNPPEILVNPFGEVYPESDFASHAVASLIRKYVWDGGVYVNTAGIPFWYRYDPKSGRRETAGRVEGIFDNQPRWTTLFHDIFPNLTPAAEPQVVQCAQTEDEIRRFGDITNAGGEKSVAMFRAYPLKPPSLLPMLYDSALSRCIIGAQEFGDGAYLLSAVVIDRANVSFEKTLAAIRAWVAYEVRGRPA